MNIEQQRAAFEALCEENNLPLTVYEDGGGYSNERTKAALTGFRAVLQSQDREDAARYRYLSSMATQQADSLGPIFRIDVRRTTPQTMFNFDAAVDHARRIEGDGE